MVSSLVIYSTTVFPRLLVDDILGDHAHVVEYVTIIRPISVNDPFLILARLEVQARLYHLSCLPLPSTDM